MDDDLESIAEMGFWDNRGSRSKRLKRNSRHEDTEELYSNNKRDKRYKDSKPLNRRNYHSVKKQPRLRMGRSYFPKDNRPYLSIPEIKSFNDVSIGPEIPSALEGVIKTPEESALENHDYADYMKPLQVFYFFLEEIPHKTLELLIKKKVLVNYAFDKDYLLRVSFGSDGYETSGQFDLSWSIKYSLRGGEKFNISRELSKEIFESAKYSQRFLDKMLLFGFFDTQPKFEIDYSNRVAEYFGIKEEELQEAHMRFFNDRDNFMSNYATFRRPRDMRKNKYVSQSESRLHKKEGDTVIDKERGKLVRRRVNKHPYKLPRQVKGEHKKSLDVIIVEENGKKSKEKRRDNARVIYEHEKFIEDLPSLYRACLYVNEGVRKAQWFRHRIEVINEPLQMLLNYIQSRTDRNLEINIDSVLALHNAIVNSRLGKWENRTNKGIASINHLLGGKFYDYDSAKYQTGAKEDSLLLAGNEIKVPKNYYRNPEKYILSSNDLKVAVRRILSGKKPVSWYRVLDPKTQVILSYCSEVKSMSNGSYAVRPESISSVKVPELRMRLQNANLLNYKPNFVFQ